MGPSRLVVTLSMLGPVPVTTCGPSGQSTGTVKFPVPWEFAPIVMLPSAIGDPLHVIVIATTEPGSQPDTSTVMFPPGDDVPGVTVRVGPAEHARYRLRSLK